VVVVVASSSSGEAAFVEPSSPHAPKPIAAATASAAIHLRPPMGQPYGDQFEPNRAAWAARASDAASSSGSARIWPTVA